MSNEIERKAGKNRIEAIRSNLREKNEVRKINKQIQKEWNKIERKKCFKNRK